MVSPEAVGLVAGALTTLMGVPQAARIFRRHSALDVSWGFIGMWGAGTLLWLSYGLLLSLLVVMVWNSAGIVLVGVLALGKARYGKFGSDGCGCSKCIRRRSSNSEQV
jgi:MtN3 and saliva related transmembrane protein